MSSASRWVARSRNGCSSTRRSASIVRCSPTRTPASRRHKPGTTASARSCRKARGRWRGATMERWFSDGFRAGDADKVAATDKVFRATSAEGYAASAAALRDMDMREALRVIDRPVLLVTGRGRRDRERRRHRWHARCHPRGAACRARLQAHLQHRGAGGLRRRRDRVPDRPGAGQGAQAARRQTARRPAEVDAQAGDAACRRARCLGAQSAQADAGGRRAGAAPAPGQSVANRGESRSRQGESAQGRAASLAAAGIASPPREPPWTRRRRRARPGRRSPLRQRPQRRRSPGARRRPRPQRGKRSPKRR